MSTRRILPIGITIVLLALLSGGLVQAQGPAGAVPATLPGSSPDAAVGPGFTYQGQLKDGSGNPIDSTCTLTLSLWDALSAGSQVGGNCVVAGVVVTDGYFTALVNQAGEFGAGAFDGQARWLAIAVQCTGDGSPVPLSPRQPLSAAPYAHYALQVPEHDHWGEAWTGSGYGLEIYGGTVGLLAGGSTWGVYALVEATAGIAIYGDAEAHDGAAVYGDNTSVSGTAYGVHGRSRSTAGYGVYGEASATSGSTYGVYGQAASTAGRAVYGRATAATGETYGVSGRADSNDGTGVSGLATSYSGTTRGVLGLSNSNAGIGVLGWAASTAGTTYGVWGWSSSSAGYGVYGDASASSGETYGVYGRSASNGGYGVYGTGFRGVTGQTNSSMSGSAGVHGIAGASAFYGVAGVAASTTGSGVAGWAAATSGVNHGVYGHAYSPNGYGVYYVGGLGGTGLMTSIVETPAEGWRHLYAVASPQVLFEDVGTAQLVNGQAVVPIDPLFAQTVNLEQPYQVFLTGYGESPTILWVTAKTAASFTVRGVTLDGQAADVSFDYRLIATRLGYEDTRLAPAAAPDLAAPDWVLEVQP